MRKYFDLFRIKHWIKNILIFIPFVCAKVINIENIFITLLGFFSFSFAASFIYIVNDIKDIENDKLHPRKKNRPIASGKISKENSMFISVIILLISIILNYLVNSSILCFSLLVIYVFINILYSFGLKDIAIMDIVLLASGFIIRIYYGASLVGVEVSDWLFLTILSGALFLGLGKRKKELLSNKYVRKALKDYNESFLDKFQNITLTLTLVFYSLWAMEQNIKFMIYTVILVIIIFMKYLLSVEKNNEGDPATIFYSDKGLMLLGLLYLIIMFLLLVVL